ncbi:hypothetical protein V2J09_004865 [Rumex salicifolius]
MLAAAACSSMLGKESGNAEDGLGIEEPSVHEGPVNVTTNSQSPSLSKGLVKEECVNISDTFTGVTSSCETTALAGEFAATPSADCTSEKVENIEKCIKEPFHEDGTPNMSSDVSSMRDDDVAGSQNLQCQDHRLHWDLNVVMDAWDQPFHDQNVQTSDHDLLNEHESPICEIEKKLLHYEPRKSLDRISEGNSRIQVDNRNDISQSVSLCEMSVQSECKNVPSSLGNAGISDQPSLFKCVNETLPVLKRDNKPTGESINFDLAALFTHQSNHPVPDRTCAAVTNNTRASVIDTQVRVTHQPNLGIENELTLKSMMPDKPFDDRRLSLKDEENCAHIYMTSQVNNDAVLEKLQKENDHPQSKQEFNVTASTKANNDNFFMNGSGKVEVDFHLSTKEVKIASAEHFEEKFVSDAADPCSTHATEAAGKLQDDNDSQYEDGELREPSRHLWEEYDAVNEKSEPVDYVCDKSIYSVTAADHCDSELGQTRRIQHHDAGNVDVISSSRGVAIVHDPETDRLIAEDNDHGKDENVLKLVHSGDEKMKGPATSEMLDSNRMSLAPVARVGDDCEGKGRIYDLATRPPDPEDTNTRIGSRLFGRALMSENEGQCGHDRSFREDQTVNRSKLDGVAARWDRGSNYMKSSESVRYPMQSQPRAHPANNWHGSSDVRRGIKRNFSPTYNTHARQLDEREDTVAKEDRDGTLSTVSYLSHPPTNDESIADANAAGNFQPNHKLHGGLGSDRMMNRGRFIRYGRQMDHGSAGRGRYHGPSPDDSFQSSLKYRRPLSQRDSSFSPNERSRSPDPRVFTRVRSAADPRVSPRGRSAGGDSGGPYVRYKSRSPNFRSEARTPRMRSPPNHQRFGADRMTGFRSFQRDHGSPPSRWINNRKDDLGHLNYKQRPMLDESPNRNRMRSDRTDHLEFVRNPKPDPCYRQNTGRFSEMDAASRPHRLEENYDNRRQFGPINTARRGYEDGIPKRLHNGDDGFVSMNRDVGEFNGRGNRDIGRGNRDIDNRNGDMPRKFRRDTNFMYDRDGKFGSNSKQFGFGGMDSSRNMKSGEPYRSVNPGRFNEMDGAGRGQRYVDRHDERRRPFSTVYLPRRGEMEGIGRRLSHDVDDNNPGRRLNHDVDNLPGRRISHDVDDNLPGRRISHDVDDNLPVLQSSCNDDTTDSHGRNQRGIVGRMDDLPNRQREEQHIDLSGQEKKVT